MISNVKVCCVQKVIPLAFDESLSYLEMLCGMLDKLNETIDEVNRMTEIVDNIDVNFDEINEKIDIINETLLNMENQFTSIDERVSTNSNNINILNIKIDDEINTLNNTLRNLINENFNTLKTYVDYQDTILDEKIDNIQIGAINIYDPTTGILSPLQTVVNNLYQLTNKDGLTANEFDTLDLTAQAFDNYQITAYEFDSQGKAILI